MNVPKGFPLNPLLKSPDKINFELKYIEQAVERSILVLYLVHADLV